MPGIVPADIESYAEAHTSPPSPALATVVEQTRAMGAISGMMTGPVEGRFLEFLVFALRPSIVLELGTFTGYSSLSMARGLADGGRVITLDVNEETTAIARRYAEEAGVADRIEYRLGPGLETLADLEGPFDIIFVDADKENYVNYYEAVLPMLAPDGLLLADNALRDGRVLADGDEPMKTFNDHVLADERVECVLLTVRDGILLVRKR